MERGDVIVQRRSPGGACLLLRTWETKEEYTKDLKEAGAIIWTDDCFPVLRLLHPNEGVIEDASYYYAEFDCSEFITKKILRR